MCPVQAAPVAGARLQPHMPVQALLQKSSGTIPAVSPSADTGEGADPVGIPRDRVERRYGPACVTAWDSISIF